MLRRALSAHERLERVVLSERGLDGVASELAALIGGPALIFDARGELLARRGEAPVAALRSRELRERVARGRRGAGRPGRAPAGRAGAARWRGGPHTGRGEAPLPEAWLIAARDAGPLNELDRLTLHQAVTIVALELLRRRVVDDTERRLAGDVMTALVAGDLAGRTSRAGSSPSACASGPACWCSPPPRLARAAAEEALARRRARGGRRRARRAHRALPVRAAAGARRRRAVRAGRAPARAGRAGARRGAPCGRGAHGRAGRAAARLPRGALRARGAGAGGQRRRDGAPRSPPTATSAPSSCCCRCRTTTRCGSSATRSWPRSRNPRAPTGAS